LISDRSLLLVARPARAASVADIEELPDWYLHRPAARRIVDMLLTTAVTPDQVTIWSGVTGLLAGGALVLGAHRPALRLVSAALLFVSVVLDCVDGQLARARRTMSTGGTALDTIVDVVVSLSMLLAATYFIAQQPEPRLLWVLAPVALVSYAVQCFFFDVAKERYLIGHGLRYASSKSVLAAGDAGASDINRRGRDDILGRLFDRYWMVTRKLTLDNARTPSAGGAPGPFFIRACTFLGQGTHMALLYTATAASYFWPSALYVCLVVFSTVMNASMVLLLLNDAGSIRS
jgi:phosphatidylglycerophosphate synthase